MFKIFQFNNNLNAHSLYLILLVNVSSTFHTFDNGKMDGHYTCTAKKPARLLYDVTLTEVFLIVHLRVVQVNTSPSTCNVRGQDNTLMGYSCPTTACNVCQMVS